MSQALSQQLKTNMPNSTIKLSYVVKFNELLTMTRVLQNERVHWYESPLIWQIKTTLTDAIILTNGHACLAVEQRLF